MKSTMRTVQDDHEWARATIPWMANRTLDEASARRLRAHIELCPECRDDLAAEQQIACAVSHRKTVEYAPQAGLARMMKRVDRRGRFLPRNWFSASRPGGLRRGLAVFVITAQAAAVAALALSLFWTSRAPEGPAYVLAGATAPSLPHLQVIFDEKVTAGEILSTIAGVKGRLLSGPSSTGVYLVAIEGGDGAMDSAAQALQDHPHVHFVAVVRPPPER